MSDGKGVRVYANNAIAATEREIREEELATHASGGSWSMRSLICILGLHLSVCWVLGIRKEKSAVNIRVTSTMRNRSWSSGLLIPLQQFSVYKAPS